MSNTYEGYLKEVTLDNGVTTYTIPIWNLDIKVIPWHSSGNIMVEYFYGKNVTRIQGYRLKASFDMFFGHDGVDDQLWSDLLNDMANDVEWTIDFDPENAGQRTETFVMDQSSAPLSAMFSGHIRNRPTNTEWVSPDILAEVPWWVTATEQSGRSPLSDLFDLILLEPGSDNISLVSGPPGELLSWQNNGTTGDAGTFDVPHPWGTDGMPSACLEDPYIGLVLGYGDTDEAVEIREDGIFESIEGDAAQAEIWFVSKTPGAGGELGGLKFGSGNPPIFIHADKFVMSMGLQSMFGTCPTGFADNQWHVFRIVFDLAADSISFEVDGYPFGGFEWSFDIQGIQDSKFYLGSGSNTIVTVGQQLALFKLTSGLVSAGRAREIYAYLRDTFNISAIPADGTPTIAITGNISSAYIARVPFYIPQVISEIDDQQGFTGNGWTIKKDIDNEYVYIIWGGSTQNGRVYRYNYSGSGKILATNVTQDSTPARGLAINPAAGEIYTTHFINGVDLRSHSIDPANATDAYTELIGSGSYQMNESIEYNPNDDLIYFIDSLAGTPQLHTITTAGAADTVVKNLTAGKLYRWMCLSPYENVLYWTNDTDGTIEKYDIDTDTLTTAYTTPAATPWGIDIGPDRLWYNTGADGKIYEVAFSDPSTHIFKGNTYNGGGIAVIIFDTTA